MGSIVISALLHKKAEMLGEIERLEDEITNLRRRVVHIDSTLDLFGYDNPKPVQPYRKPPPGLFRRGEIVRFIFRRIRMDGPQTAVQLRDALIGFKDVNRDDRKLRKQIHNKVHKALQRQKERGTLVKYGEVWRAR
ncbi:MAG: hypothetical protein RIC85_05395 [Gammaproteobacteria bacterium]|uniref:hypothetical protein n=1 Tax=Thalassobaculum sp. TaxID=2022740 RepID=UPI0032EB5E74